MSNPASFDLERTYIHLHDGPAASPIEVGPTFWSDIEKRTDLRDGRLVGVFHYATDWPTWEMHPAGDEIVYLLSGAVDLILEEEDGERVVELRDRAACIVPRGIWHRGIVHRPADALHITRGAGTQIRKA